MVSLSITKGNPLAPSVNGNPWYDPGGLFKHADKNNVSEKNATYVAGPMADFAGGEIIDAPNGETPLAQLPQYGGAGGSSQAASYYAGQAFQKTFGRNPTQSELALLTPSYISGDPNIANTNAGNAAVASYYQQLSNTPDNIAKQQQQKYLKEAPQHYDAVKSLFQSQLGREATKDELDHFGSALASGTTDSYQLQQFLQQQPEYQTKQNTQFQNDLSGKLAGYDADYFSKNILPSIQESYAKQGRSLDSSALTAAAANASENQSSSRGQYIAGLSAQQYGGVEDRAYQDYANQVAQQQNLTNSGINARYTGVQNTINRSQEVQDYNTQQQLYNQYLAKYGKRSPASGAVSGATSGAALGTAVLPGWGTAIGAVGGGVAGYLGGSY